MSAAHQLTEIGFEINQEWLRTVLLAGLPEHYQPMIMALESSGMQITGDSVKIKLLQESNCIGKSKLSTDHNTACHVTHSRNMRNRNRNQNTLNAGLVANQDTSPMIVT